MNMKNFLACTIIGSFLLIPFITYAAIPKPGDKVNCSYAKNYLDGIVKEVYGKLVLVSFPQGEGWCPITSLAPMNTFEADSGFVIPKKDEEATASWKVGDPCLALWPDGKLYPGKIAEKYGKVFFIQFDDGDTIWVEYKFVQPKGPMASPQGTFVKDSLVFAMWPQDGKWYPAKIISFDGNKYTVAYPDGYTATLDSYQIKPATYTYSVGDRVVAMWSNKQWYPGTIDSIGQTEYHITFDDGDNMWAPPTVIVPMAIHLGK